MHIDSFKDDILHCRFCFMCRHLSAIGNVRFTEADTPRIRAAMLYGLSTGTNQLDDDLIATLYRQDLSACCRHHCVNHYDENGIALAARADVVEAGLAPAAVRKLAAEMKASAFWKITGKGEVAYMLDSRTAEAKTVAPAVEKLFKKAGVEHRVITGGCVGKCLRVLGFLTDAAAAAEAFAAFVAEAGVKTLVVSNPALYDALVKDFPAMGIKLTAKVQHTTQFFGKIKFAKKAGALYYLADDFLRNYDGLDAPEKFLRALGAVTQPFGTNNEETYCCGEGAVVLDKLDAGLVKKLAEYVAARADDPKQDLLVTASPYTKVVLEKTGRLNVKTLEEVAASCL